MKKKTLLTSLMSIAMLASITTGATYALFTAEDTANIVITSAKVKVEAKVLEDFAIKSLDTDLINVNGSGTFSTGGTATVSNGDIKLTHTEVETTKKDPGKVLTQSRAPGSPIVKGSTLRVEIAKAPTEKPKEESKDDEKPSTESTE